MTTNDYLKFNYKRTQEIMVFMNERLVFQGQAKKFTDTPAARLSEVISDTPYGTKQIPFIAIQHR